MLQGSKQRNLEREAFSLDEWPGFFEEWTAWPKEGRRVRALGSEVLSLVWILIQTEPLPPDMSETRGGNWRGAGKETAGKCSDTSCVVKRHCDYTRKSPYFSSHMFKYVAVTWPWAWIFLARTWAGKQKRIQSSKCGSLLRTVRSIRWWVRESLWASSVMFENVHNKKLLRTTGRARFTQNDLGSSLLGLLAQIKRRMISVHKTQKSQGTCALLHQQHN